MTTETRIPPIDKAAEQCVIASMALEPSCIGDVRAILEGADFATPNHATIFNALCLMYDAGQPIDLVTLKDELTRLGELDRIGGMDTIMDMLEGVPDAANVKYYAGIVKDKATQRAAIMLGQRLYNAGFKHQENVAEWLASVEAELYGLSSAMGTGGELVQVGEAARELLGHTEKVYRGEIPPNLMVGIDALDQITGGLAPGEVVTLAGRPSCGKTALADTIARNVAQKGGKVVACSVEMLARERAKRFLQGLTSINGYRIKLPKNLRPGEWDELCEAANKLGRTPVYIYADGAMTTGSIRQNVRRAAHHLGGVDFITIDYAQILTPTKGNSRVEELAYTVRDVKTLAMEFHVPVLLLAQFNRSGTTDETKPPSMYQLAGSSEFENTSSVVWLLHRPPLPPTVEETQRSEVWLRQSKCRDGETTQWEGEGAVRLRWHADSTTFEENWRL